MFHAIGFENLVSCNLKNSKPIVKLFEMQSNRIKLYRNKTLRFRFKSGERTLIMKSVSTQKADCSGDLPTTSLVLEECHAWLQTMDVYSYEE